MSHAPLSVSCRQPRGFTLVELLVVIGIIALLISVLLPALNRARDAARTVQCLSNVRQMAIASMMFAREHRGRVQSCSHEAWMRKNDPQRLYFEYGQGTTGDVPKDWASALIPYLGGLHTDTFETAKDKLREIFRCPSDRFMEQEPKGYFLWNNVSSGPNPISYGINADITACLEPPATGPALFHASGVMNVWKGDLSKTGTAGLGQSLNARIDRVSKPTETLLFADCGTYPTVFGSDIFDRNDILAYSTNWNPNGGTLRAIQMTSWLKGRIPRDRHGKKINVAFCDGHGETAGEQDWDKIRVSPWKFETPATPAPLTW